MKLSLTQFSVFFIFLNAAKVPLAFLGFHHSIASFAQLFMIFIYLILFAILKQGKISDLLSSIFLFYHLLLAAKDLSLYLITSAEGAHPQAVLLSLSRSVAIYALYVIFRRTPQNFNAQFVLKISLLYLLMTTVISALQSPFSQFSGYMSNILSDITSANHIGFFRSTGGVGGTVIDYAVYLAFSSFLIFLVRYRYRNFFSSIFIFAFGLGVFFAFSRSLFVVVAFGVFSVLFTLNRKFLIPMIFITLILSIFTLGLINDYIISLWNLNLEISSQSDAERLSGWSKVLSNMTLLEFILGAGVGGNSGFGGVGGKLSGDGFLVTYIFEYGLLGSLLLILLIYKFLKEKFVSSAIFVPIFTIFLFLIAINSGFEKTFNYGYFFIILSSVSAALQRHFQNTSV